MNIFETNSLGKCDELDENSLGKCDFEENKLIINLLASLQYLGSS